MDNLECISGYRLQREETPWDKSEYGDMRLEDLGGEMVETMDGMVYWFPPEGVLIISCEGSLGYDETYRRYRRYELMAEGRRMVVDVVDRRDGSWYRIRPADD